MNESKQLAEEVCRLMNERAWPEEESQTSIVIFVDRSWTRIIPNPDRGGSYNDWIIEGSCSDVFAQGDSE